MTRHEYDSTFLAKVERRLAIWSSRKTIKPGLNTGIVSFTFDDVPQSACRLGREVLERQGIRGTYYICGGCTGLNSPTGPFHHRDDLLRLIKNGHEIGCHGYGHRNYQALTPDMIRADIFENKRFFEDSLGCKAATDFAYPFGCVSPMVKRIVSPMFASARGARRRSNSGSIDLALLNSVPLYEHLWDRHASLARLVERAAQHKGWLIFITHDVLTEPSGFGCKPSLLEFVIRNAKELGLQVLPISEVLEKILPSAL